MKRTLLIDGDILAYQVAAMVETPLPWDDEGELWTTHWYPREGYDRMDTQLQKLEKELDADEIVITLSDKENFRKEIYPEYKSNRKNQRKPFPLPQMKEYLEENYKTYIRPTLEADDVMGILSTHPTLIKGEKIIVSIDKDMQTIPGKLLNLNKAKELLNAGEISSMEEAIVTVTTEDADTYHLLQTLSGDTTDGYPGCPGIGGGKAQDILNNPVTSLPYEHEFTRGPRKGQTELRYKEGEPCSQWEAVRDQFIKAGLNEAEALVQARVARILRHTDYDFKKKRVIKWKPQ